MRVSGCFVPLPFLPRSFRLLAVSSKLVSSPLSFVPTLDTVFSINYFILLFHDLYTEDIFIFVSTFTRLYLSGCMLDIIHIFVFKF